MIVSRLPGLLEEMLFCLGGNIDGIRVIQILFGNGPKCSLTRFSHMVPHVGAIVFYKHWL